MQLQKAKAKVADLEGENVEYSKKVNESVEQARRSEESMAKEH